MDATPIMPTRHRQTNSRILKETKTPLHQKKDPHLQIPSNRTNIKEIAANMPEKTVFSTLVAELILRFKNSCENRLLTLRIRDLFDLSAGVFSDDLKHLLLPSILR